MKLPITKEACRKVGGHDRTQLLSCQETVEFHPKHFLSENIDVFSLGNTLYYLLTGLELHGKEDKQSRLKGVSNLGAEGGKPIFPQQVRKP